MHQGYGEFSALSSGPFPFAIPQALRKNCRDMPETLKDRITQRLRDKGLSARQASLAAGMAPDTVGKVLAEKTQNLRGDNLTELARVLGVSSAWLATGSEGEDAERPRDVAFGGVVEAGAFRPVELYNQDGEHRRVPLPPDSRFPAASQFAFRVEGDSMVNAGILPGMYLLAVELHAWERLRGEPGDGLRVIVAHTRDGHPERELTVKTLRIFRDRLELRPESPNPAHKPLVYPWPPTPDADRQTQILAVVLAATLLLA